VTTKSFSPHNIKGDTRECQQIYWEVMCEQDDKDIHIRDITLLQNKAY